MVGAVPETWDDNGWESWNDVIEALRKTKTTNVDCIAAILGLESGKNYDELEMHESEVWSLSISEFIRLCLMLNVMPECLILDGTYKVKGAQVKIEPGSISETIVARVADFSKLPDIELRVEEIKAYLESDFHLASLSLYYLDQLCISAKISTVHVLDTFMTGLGWPLSNTTLTKSDIKDRG